MAKQTEAKQAQQAQQADYRLQQEILPLPTRAQRVMPRYRHRERVEYVFAARFRRKRDSWLVIGRTFFGTMGEAVFRATYRPSNAAAREMVPDWGAEA